jgi:hypothetical protein
MADPMAGLTSVWMQRLISEAREEFDWVIIDTPPVGLMTDANLLAAMADGVVLVVKAGATPYQMVKHPTGDIEADIETIWDIYRPAIARFPEKVADMKLRPSGLKSPLEHSSETEDGSDSYD